MKKKSNSSASAHEKASWIPLPQKTSVKNSAFCLPLWHATKQQECSFTLFQSSRMTHRRKAWSEDI